MSNLNPFKPSVVTGYDMLAIREAASSLQSQTSVAFFDFGDIADPSPIWTLDFGLIGQSVVDGVLNFGSISDSPPVVYINFGLFTDTTPVTNHNLDLGTIA